MTLRIPREMLDEIIDHSRSELPRECCGLIAGKDGVPTRLFRIRNSEAGNRMYVMDAEDQFHAERAMDAAGETVYAIYHSHPVTEAAPSKTDVEHAYWPESNDLIWPEAIHLICSMADESAPIVRAWQLSRTANQETPLT